MKDKRPSSVIGDQAFERHLEGKVSERQAF